MHANRSPSPVVKASSPIVMTLFWLYVGLPLAWGIWSTLQKAAALFH